jgi:hypothetical protein
MYPLRTQPVPDRRDDAPVAPDPRDPPDSIWTKKKKKKISELPMAPDPETLPTASWKKKKEKYKKKRNL